MKYYTIKTMGRRRVIRARPAVLSRLAFRVAGERVKFEVVGNEALAVVDGVVQVFKKPHPSTFHKEYMRLNARAQWLGDACASDDYIMEGMLELEEEV